MSTVTICGFLLITYIQVSLGYFPHLYFTPADQLCFEELNLDKQIVRDAFNENYILQEGNPKIEEFVSCTFKKTNYLNENGNLNVDEFKRWVKGGFFNAQNRNDIENKDEVVEKAMTACESIKGKNVGDTAIKVYNCLMEHVRLA